MHKTSICTVHVISTGLKLEITTLMGDTEHEPRIQIQKIQIQNQEFKFKMLFANCAALAASCSLLEQKI